MGTDQQDKEGWRKQGIVVPEAVWGALRQHADRHGHGAMRTLATAGLGLLAGMPDHIRIRLLRWTTLTLFDHGPQALTPEAIWAEFELAFREDLDNAAPLVTPPVLPPVTGSTETRRERQLPSPGTHRVTRIVGPKDKRGGAA